MRRAKNVAQSKRNFCTNTKSYICFTFPSVLLQNKTSRQEQKKKKNMSKNYEKCEKSWRVLPRICWMANMLSFVAEKYQNIFANMNLKSFFRHILSIEHICTCYIYILLVCFCFLSFFFEGNTLFYQTFNLFWAIIIVVIWVFNLM